MKIIIIMLFVFWVGNVSAIKDNNSTSKIQKEILSEHIMGLPKQNTTGKEGIYYHNGTMKDINNILDANDGSYRYAGSDKDVDNYVCIGNEKRCSDNNMYRIIGVFDGKVKLIKSTPIGKIAWDPARDGYEHGSNTWSTSKLKKGLNGEDGGDAKAIIYYTDYIKPLVDSGKIEMNHHWSVGGNSSEKIEYSIPSVVYQNEVLSPSGRRSENGETHWDGPVGLMYASDAAFAALPGPETNVWNTILHDYLISRDYLKHIYDWLCNEQNQWTISRLSDSFYTNEVMSVNSYIISSTSAANLNAVRPVFYLESKVGYSGGKGTKTDPYRLLPHLVGEEDNEETLAEHIMKLPQQNTTGKAGIYYHNGTIKDINTIIDANDGSYRYAGADPDNYVCIGNDSECSGSDKENYMYRIIGVFDGKVKLIKSTPIGKIAWDPARDGYEHGSNTWSTSKLKKGLNGEDGGDITAKKYYNTYIKPLIDSGKIEINHHWSVGGNSCFNITYSIPKVTYQNEVVNPSGEDSENGETHWDGPVGLMYVSDYGYAELLGTNNWSTILSDYDSRYINDWLFSNIHEWTISRTASGSDNLFVVYFCEISNSYADILGAVRPAFYLESKVGYFGGKGTKTDPYKLLPNLVEDEDNKNSESQKENSTQDENTNDIDESKKENSTQDENPNTGAFLNYLFLGIILLISIIMLIINKRKKVINKI